VSRLMSSRRYAYAYVGRVKALCSMTH